MSKVYIRVGENGQMPTYASEFSAGADLYVSADCVIRPGESKVLPMDFVMALEPDVEAQVRPRSGLSLKTTLRVPNAPGTIDSDYRNEVGVIVENTFDEFRLLNTLRDAEKRAKFLEEHREVSYAEYLARVDGAESGDSANSAGRAEVTAIAAVVGELPESFRAKTLFVDENGNPAGTIYLKKGERIAQMVLAKYVKAEFVAHDAPEKIGEDRGGGFGHSGV